MRVRKDLKTIRVPRGYLGLRIELPGCVVTIRVGLHDRDWQEQTAIEVLADGERYAGERPWFATGSVDWHSAWIRVVQEMPGSEFSQRRKQALIKGTVGSLACAVG